MRNIFNQSSCWAASESSVELPASSVASIGLYMSWTRSDAEIADPKQSDANSHDSFLRLLHHWLVRSPGQAAAKALLFSGYPFAGRSIKKTPTACTSITKELARNPRKRQDQVPCSVKRAMRSSSFDASSQSPMTQRHLRAGVEGRVAHEHLHTVQAFLAESHAHGRFFITSQALLRRCRILCAHTLRSALIVPV